MARLPDSKLLPSPQKKGGQRPGSAEQGLVAEEIDGIALRVSPEQKRFLKLLDDNDYVPAKVWAPLWANKRSFGKRQIDDLRMRMKAAGITAVVVGRKRRGYRLESAP